jgi:hypothetical protein
MLAQWLHFVAQAGKDPHVEEVFGALAAALAPPSNLTALLSASSAVESIFRVIPTLPTSAAFNSLALISRLPALTEVMLLSLAQGLAEADSPPLLLHALVSLNI